LYFNDRPSRRAELKAQFLVNAQKTPQPELQIRADKATEFKIVKKIIGDAKDSGMVHVAFMTTDSPKGQ
jgi:biopolymer transport protein ExbD